MKAAYIETTGGPEVINYGDVPLGELKPGEVRVAVAAASVNPIETYIRSGLVAMQLPKPYILGCDLAGTIVEVGPGVSRVKKGDRVWGSNQGLQGRQGVYAEFANVHEDFLYATPAGVSDEDAAASALVGITAHLGLFQCAGLKAGEAVFVNGGTGGVGAMVVQMAKAIGAKAITTVGSREKADLAKSLGADVVLNYRTDDIVAGVKAATDGKGVHVWFETQPPTDLDKTIDAMASRGRMVVMAGRGARPVFPNGPFYVKGLTLVGFAMFNMSTDEQRVCADDINRWLSEKTLRPIIGKRMRFSEAAAAHQLQEENTLKKAGTLQGKIVMLP
jgi:NADPH2:quinone reductase